MKSIGYQDRTGGRISLYVPTETRTRSLFMPSRWTRFWAGYEAMRGLGHIHLVQVKGNKVQRLATRGY